MALTSMAVFLGRKIHLNGYSMREAYYHSILMLIFSPLRPILHTQMHTCSSSKERWRTEKKCSYQDPSCCGGFWQSEGNSETSLRVTFSLRAMRRITAGEQHRLENCVICYNMPAPPHSAVSGFDTSRVSNVANYNCWKHGPLHCRT